MKAHSEDWDELRRKVLGLGDSSIRKTHYPSLQRRLEELERFRSLVDLSSDLLFMVECPCGPILDVSAACCERLGVPREFLLSRSFSDLICAAKRAQTVQELESLCAGEQQNQMVVTELEVPESGSRFPVEIAARSLRYETSKIAIFAARDITERQKSERRILKLNRLYRVITEVNKTIVKTEERSDLFEKVCRICADIGDFRLARIALFDGDEMVPAAWAGDDSICSVPTRSITDHPCAAAARGGHDYVCNQLADDSPCHREAQLRGYNSACAVSLTCRGNAIGVLTLYSREPGLFDAEEVELLHGVASDISFALDSMAREEERSRAEQAQKETLRKIEAIFEASPVAIMALDIDRRVTLWNKTAEQLFGWCSEEVLGQPTPVFAEERRPEHQQIWDSILRGERYSGELKRRCKDGRELDVSASIAPLRDGFGEVCGGIAMYADIAERKRMQTQLQQANKLESIGRLAGGIAHDFNNLLTVINGHAELLLGMLPPEARMRRNTGEILKAGQRAAEMTRQLLAFSRAQVLQPKILPVNQTVIEMEDLLRRLIGEDVQLVTALAPECGAVKADGSQLQQMIMNLVVNARDAIRSGGTITIRTDRLQVSRRTEVPDLGPGEYVSIAVADDGIGMDEETQRHIFEPFFTTKPVGRGTGLGLSTVWGIVKQSGGQITVSSKIYGGTTFTIYLPRVESSAVAQSVQQADTLPSGTETLLLVEDREDVRLLTSEILKKCGYRVLTAENPREAITLWQRYRESISLIISDVVMPEMSGPDMAARIREQRPEVKVLFVSGHGRSSVLEASASFLEKPYSPSRLARTVDALLHPAARQVA